MIQKEELEKRLQEMDWTLYRLAKEVAERRASRTGEKVLPASRYHTTLSKAIKNPAEAKLETIEDIVQIFNGKLTIVWEADKVVTIHLEEQIIEALKEKAENEGKIIDEIAKQILLQALSGIPSQTPKKLPELIIDRETKICRSFHPLIASAYSAVHQWLGKIQEAKGYKELDYDKDIQRAIKQNNLKSVAFQFYTLFPRHYFESAHVLENVINQKNLLRGLKYNPRLCLIDVGCAMGVATAAFIERILILQKEENISHPIEIFCLGIDPNIASIAIYSKLMQEIKKNLSFFNINLEFQPICEPVTEAMMTALGYLKKKREIWKKPVISNLFVMQLDVTSSLNKDQILKREQAEKLRDLGLEPDFIPEAEKEFWQAEALSYKQLLEEVPIENLHLMTVETKHLKIKIKEISQTENSSQIINKISQSIKKVMGDRMTIPVSLEEEQKVNFENPPDSYWFNLNELTYLSNFYASFQTIINNEIATDNEWQELLSLGNLKLAWVRARRNLLDESLYDDIEIRLFENNLQENLQIIQDKLFAYSEKIIPSNEEINYLFLKGVSKSRPKQLSRLEEEIIATALIQTIGRNRKTTLDFYSYQLDNQETEYLYEIYIEGYKKYLSEAKISAEENKDGIVIRTDIKSYYKEVIKEKLLAITTEELEVKNNRIKWLMEQIISPNLPGHKDGKGIKQGTLTSGFYANLYLKPIDEYFKKDKKWKNKVYFHRYVDDIILVVRYEVNFDNIEPDLKSQIKALDLELNENKTEYYDDISEFLETVKPDNYLSELSKEFNLLLYPLWMMNYNYRTQFEFANSSDNHSLWWHLIKLYQQCLYSVKIYVTEIYLSRKIYQYLAQKNINKNRELNLPNFITNDNFVIVYNWANNFESLNSEWIDKKNSLKNRINNLFTESLKELRQKVEKIKTIDNSSIENKKIKRQLIVEQRKLETKIRFSVGKLAILGFDEVWQEIVNLICDKELFVIRDLFDVIVSLARQGNANAIKQLTECYQNREEETSPYIRAIILEAIRFLPILDISDWELIFLSATDEQKSDIEKLKSTETWLHLRDIVKPFVQYQHIQAVIKALNSVSPSFPRLKKNYILILGVYAPEELINITLSKQDKEDYIIKDAYNLAIKGKVSELFQEIEPSILGQYYSTKQPDAGSEKQTYS